jgi:hypothetical protein
MSIDGVKTCEMCHVKFKEKDSHVCDPPALMDRIRLLNGLVTNLGKMLTTEFAWTFTLSDGVAVKVEFHTNGQISKSHVEAFSKIFSSVASSYVADQEEP